jgi:sarcosine oxidase
MTTRPWDVIVAGLGAAGASALHALAARGARALGLDRFAPPHALGSSHGASRIIREAYFEDPCYVPLVQAAYRGWRSLEAATGERLLTETGGLMIGAPDSALVRGALASARAHGLPHDLLDAPALRELVPAFTFPTDHVAVFEPRAGVLAPERAIGATLARARALGATLATDQPLLAWQADAHGVTVTTPAGRHVAERLVLATGAWMGEVLADLALPLVVERNVLAWFDPPPGTPTDAFAPDRFPVFLHEVTPALTWYGFPDFGDGIKVAQHGGGEATTADAVRRTVDAADLAPLRGLLAAHLPAANGQVRAAVACPYTRTPDGHFVLDRHPAHPAVIVASPCSGHGFKFAPAIGAVLADLATGAPPAFDLTPFSLRRFPRQV